MRNIRKASGSFENSSLVGLPGANSPFYVAHSWEMLDLKPIDLARASFAVLTKTACVPVSLVAIGQKPSLGTAIAIYDIGCVFGRCERADFLYRQLRLLSRRFFEDFDFSADGVVPFDERGPGALYTEVNTYFNQILIVAKQLLDYMQRDLREYSPEGYDEWVRVASAFYDDALGYAFCYDFRNCIEHENAVISIVNVGANKGAAGFAINIDGDFAFRRIKKTTRLRLHRFAERRKAQGESPWLSVGTVTWEYCCAVYALVAMYFDILLSELDNRQLAGELEATMESVPAMANCITFELPAAEDGYQVVPHALMLPDLKSIDYYHQVVAEATQAASAIYDSSGKGTST